MAERIRFHLDENVDPDIGRALRRHGIDVTTTPEVGLRSADDESQLAYIRQSQRVLVTHDVDFLALAHRDADHPGIVFCTQTRLTLGQIVRGLLLIHGVVTPQEMVGRIEFL